METRIVNTAAEPATEMHVRSPLDYESGLFSYRLSMSALRTMLNNNTITEADYNKCRDKLAQKYGISLCSIFA